MTAAKLTSQAVVMAVSYYKAVTVSENRLRFATGSRIRVNVTKNVY